MSTLREMAQEIAKRLDEDVDFFLVVRNKAQDQKTGRKPMVVATNVNKDEVVEMASAATTRLILKRMADAHRRRGGFRGHN